MPSESNEILRELALNPWNAGPVPGANARGAARCSVCGADRAELSLRIEDDHIVEGGFIGYGCASTIASTSWLLAMLEGLSIEAARDFGATDIVHALHLRPDQLHGAKVAIAALRATLRNFAHCSPPRPVPPPTPPDSPAVPLLSFHGDYCPELLQRFLLNLQEVRALDHTYHHIASDKPSNARKRETLFCMLCDVEKAIKQLPQPLREAIYWRYEQALPEREAADRLGIPRTNLQRRLAKASMQLLKILVGHAGQNPQFPTL
jgi:NifU-like protein involved in Fe-S cluster formation